ncbi:MAG TPA: ATP-binding protein, partial [Thermoanaerobaculia bacterium]|nr:ATP-binding protein [Thermoanaerobaculia bacterium]
AAPRFRSTGAIDVAGRRWRIEWVSRRRGLGGALRLASATAVGGLAIAGLLLLLLRTQLAARAQAEATAERLRASEAALQRANTAKDDFLATLSHELRTPMTAIMGWAQMLATDKLDPETERTAIEAIGRSAKVQAQLIDDLLDVSRIAAGKMRIDPKPVELAPIVTAAIDTVRAAAEIKGVRLSAELQPRVCVKGDAHRLQQVAWNLLTNAVKFTPRGGDVFVTLREEQGEAVLEVRDTGQGIDPAFMPHLFERFRQADSSTTRSHMGLGLGLAIVRHLVDLHGGAIAAESRGIGRGATFRVRLPLLLDRSAVSERAPESVSHDGLRGVRLLVVDDDEQVRNYVAAVFRASGADVRSADSVTTAMDLIETWEPDVLLSDLAMPEADGFALLDRLRESNLHIPVIALTAFASPEDRQRALAAGFDAFVPKPVDPAKLRRAVLDTL